VWSVLATHGRLDGAQETLPRWSWTERKRQAHDRVEKSPFLPCSTGRPQLKRLYSWRVWRLCHEGFRKRGHRRERSTPIPSAKWAYRGPPGAWWLHCSTGGVSLGYAMESAAILKDASICRNGGGRNASVGVNEAGSTLPKRPY